MSRFRRIVVSAGAAVALATAFIPNAGFAGGGDGGGGGGGGGKIRVCHATGSDTNPYVLIRVSRQGAEAHIREHGRGTDRAERLGRADFIVRGHKKCPPEKKY